MEEFPLTHPDVLDGQVIGVPDPASGEEVMAWLRLRDGAGPLPAEARRALCDGRIARCRIPRYVHVADEFPTTVTGEVRKVEMREESVRLQDLRT